MIRNYTPAQPRKMPFGLLLTIMLVVAIYSYINNRMPGSQAFAFATTTSAGSISFSYEVIESDITVDWSGGGDFDPRGKCPKDFFDTGFSVIFKKLADGTCVKFLYHKGKQLLYRIDQDVIKEKVKVGLHWVTGTHFNAKYRIADYTYKGGKSVAVPNAKGGMDMVQFQYGEAVSKKRVRHRRELFRETHIQPGQCTSWWDLFNFNP